MSPRKKRRRPDYQRQLPLVRHLYYCPDSPSPAGAAAPPRAPNPPTANGKPDATTIGAFPPSPPSTADEDPSAERNERPEATGTSSAPPPTDDYERKDRPGAPLLVAPPASTATPRPAKKERPEEAALTLSSSPPDLGADMNASPDPIAAGAAKAKPETPADAGTGTGAVADAAAAPADPGPYPWSNSSTLPMPSSDARANSLLLCSFMLSMSAWAASAKRNGEKGREGGGGVEKKGGNEFSGGGIRTRETKKALPLSLSLLFPHSFSSPTHVYLQCSFFHSPAES